MSNDKSKKEKYKTKFMEWGIISKENFDDIYEVPIKRWDPLSTISITTDEFGLHKKLTRYYGHYSYLSPIRGKRPQGYKAIQDACKSPDVNKDHIKAFNDVFTAITEGKAIFDSDGNQIGDGYSMIITQDEKKRENPFSNSPNKADRVPESCKALTLINRYPSMARVIEPEIYEYIQERLPSHLKLATGINLLTISRDFYPSHNFQLVPEEVLARIFLSMKEAILYCILEAIERDYYDIPVNPFFNIGTKVGGSQPRIHSQIFIDLNGDGHGSRLELFLKAFKEMGNNCHLCKTSHGDSDRIITTSDFWTFYTAGSPIRNYHIRFHPNEHIRRFTQLKLNQIRDLAKTLRNVFLALDNIGIDSNRNILFNCCPYGYDADFHMFGDIIPHEIIGGAEMADDMRVARKLPHIAASEIRNSLEEIV
jgi:UDPglucose--hexose-1-phosphate uridylyltransferase